MTEIINFISLTHILLCLLLCYKSSLPSDFVFKILLSGLIKAKGKKGESWKNTARTHARAHTHTLLNSQGLEIGLIEQNFI